jgi:integrase
VTLVLEIESEEEPAMAQQGQVLKLKTTGADGNPTWAYRYRLDGRGSARPQVGGFATQGEALEALQVALERLHRRNGHLAQITLRELADDYLTQHEAEPRTIAKLRWLLAKAAYAFGERRVVDLRSEEIGARRATLPEGHRFEATQALRQLLNRAVAWKIIDSNPAKAGVDNPRRHHPEKRPFESWAEINAVAEHLGPVYGPMVVFAAATGLRPGEWIALDQRDLDRETRVVYVRGAFAHGRLKNTKTRRSTRAVPLQAIALEALEQLPARPDTPLLFPAPHGGYLDLHNFRRRAWKAAQRAAGSSRCGGRTTCATRSRPLRCGPASLPSTSPVSWRQPDDDRPPLRPPRPRRAGARGRPPRLARGRRSRGRRVDAPWTPRPTAPRQWERVQSAID